MSECPYCDRGLPIVHPPSRNGGWHSLNGWLEPCEADGPSDEDFGLFPRTLAELEGLMAETRASYARGGWTPEMVTATQIAYRTLKAELEAKDWPDPFVPEGWEGVEAAKGAFIEQGQREEPSGMVSERAVRAAHNRAYLEACRRREEELKGKAA